jgi:hypothetical protein
MPRKFTRENPQMTGTNPTVGAIQPPLAASASGDPIYKTDTKEVVAGARALIAAMSSGRPEDQEMAKRAIARAAAPLEDDLARVDVLMGEGRTADEAWAELDRIKRAVGILPE